MTFKLDCGRQEWSKRLESSYYPVSPYLYPMARREDFLESVYEHIDRNLDGFIEKLREYLRQPSVSATGEGIEQCAHMTADFLNKLGASVSLVPTDRGRGNPVVYGKLGLDPGKRTLLIYTHYDTQPFVGQRWESPPLGAALVGNKIVARSSCESKGSLIALISAIEACKAVEGGLPINLMFVIEGEEEVGSPHLPEFVFAHARDLSKCDGMLLPGISPEDDSANIDVMLGFKGMLYFEFEVKLRDRDLHGRSATIFDNAAWRLVWALNSLKDKEDRILIDGFFDEVLEPTKNDLNMISEIAKATDEKDLLGFYGAKGFRKGLAGSALFGEYLLSPTLNIDGLVSGYTGSGGSAINPASALAKVDVRLVANMNWERTMNLIRNHLRDRGFTDIQIGSIRGYDASRSPADSKIAKALLQASSRLGLKAVLYPTAPGSAPWYLFTGAPLKIPCAWQTSLAAQARMHGPDEFVTIKEYANSTKMAAGIMHYFSTVS